ncbi:WD repeat-containing protein 3-like [Sinocyclocheilus grahami]|uniref:WD repeat-containing protein 3-like n=1 Tax=Sinocyclocheilus grahami TaxID=75366 RepID=UPI0007ACCA18|nr:PREDICTED: WD repeat-containing protein 3-like [Sinocyclocheilus grahami]
MGLTKQYLRYVASAVFGVIGNQKANIAFVTLRGGEKGRYVAVGACEHVFIWDVRKAEKVLILEGKKHEVTYLCPSPDGVHIAVGYEDGGVRIFSLLNGESNISFSGHKSAVSVIRYDALGARLVTGSRDTDVIVWDIINECGLYRLKGHKDAITQILFLESKNLLITSSKDSFVKWWDLDTQHCFKTMVGHRTEVWGMVLLNQESRLITGSADSELRAWDIQYIEEGKEVGEPQEKKVRTLLENEEDDEEGLDEEPEERILSCKKAGSVLREARDRVVSLVTDAKAKVLACHLGRSTLQVIRTMGCEYALCSLFVPGDRQIILGTKSGKIQIFDLASGSLLETTDAHDGALWSMCLSPDQRGIVTGGADKTVKFWDFELIKDQDSGKNKRLTVKHTRTLQLDEDVLCVRYSPDQRLLAVSLLDCTVKIFYTDTLKFFLSLYGHKLPVLCLDISHDSALIATGSADRNVKIWGLDFGDCHRSMFAHDDSIMFLQFVPKTHLFFTAGKDRKIKQWDADKFEHIQTLEGHHREVWCLAISPNGDHIVSSSHDKSLRLWERTREPIILEEEKEMEREAEFEESLAKGDEPVVPGETKGEAEPAGKKTIETVKAAEQIMEAIELYREESEKLEEHRAACKAAGKELPPPKMNPILVAFGNISPSRYVLEVIKKVRSSELEVSLLVLPFPYVPDLLKLFNGYVQQGLEVELVCRCLFFLLRVHFGQITSNQMLLSVIDELRTNTISKVREIRDVLGFNSAGLQFLQREIESKEDVMFFADATDRFEEKKRKRRKRERAVLTVT